MGFNLLTFARTDLWEWGQVMDNQRVKQRQKKNAENWSSISVWNAINIIISLYHTKTLLYWVAPIFKGFWKDSRDLYLCKWYRVLWNEHEKFRRAFLSLLYLQRGNREMKWLSKEYCDRSGSRTLWPEPQLGAWTEKLFTFSYKTRVQWTVEIKKIVHRLCR